MKIALFCSGRIYSQCLEEQIKHFKKIQQTYDTTIFVSLNKKVHCEKYDKTFFKALGIPKECINIEKIKTPECLYNYKKREESSYDNCYSMYYHNKRCWNLIKKYKLKYNINFDIVLKYRADLFSQDVINLQYPLYNEIYIPIINNWLGKNDQIAYGSEKVMEFYCKCVDDIVDMCDQGVLFNPEILLNSYLNIDGLNIKHFNYNYDLVKRSIFKSHYIENGIDLFLVKFLQFISFKSFLQVILYMNFSSYQLCN
jgi:hypothetical protein